MRLLKDDPQRPFLICRNDLRKLLAGLNKPTSGSVCIQRYGDDGKPKAVPELLSHYYHLLFYLIRFFVADNVLDEITFGWPRQKGCLQLKQHLTSNLQRAFNWVGLDSIPLDKDPQLLSGGYKRRLVLAIQLIGKHVQYWPWEDDTNYVAMAKRIMRANFEFLTKLGGHWWCFHDRDIGPDGNTLEVKTGIHRWYNNGMA